MWKLSVALLLALPADAQTGRPDVAWVVGKLGEAPIGFAEVWAGSSAGAPSVWRLLSTTGGILVEMNQPTISPDHYFDYGECEDANGLRSDLIVEAEVTDENSKEAAAHRAWRVDPRAAAISPVPISGLVCYNHDYGF